MRDYDADQDLKRAQAFAQNGEFESAYSVMVQMDKKSQKTPNIAYAKLQYSAMTSPETYVKKNSNG
jgi:hypothetical protein